MNVQIPIITKGFSKIYTEGQFTVNAVSDVDLQLDEGEVVGLFGPSGSGKTTLLSMLGCILRPSGGSFELYGNNVVFQDDRKLTELRKKYISFIFQGFNLFPALTAFENVMLVLKLKGIEGNPAEQRAIELLSAVGLQDRIHFLPRDLSGGQKQRVAIARALAADAPLILADEPTGNLDFVNGRKVMEVLNDLAKKQNRCVIVATHDNRIEDVFDRIIYMEDGRVIREKRREG
ncbi:MAG: hypothetical protein A2X58_01215 [Nitrospirae bacterium GWC2_56_14]|nr:MAG: hypothetical protein A2X58_01215 [Nitrospirae bacterium GWC2_56_14]